MIFLLTSTGAFAETKSPYKVDFNTSISTSENNFKVASGWGHIVSGYWSEEDYETYYPNYFYSATGGIGGTGSLKIDTQTAVGGSYSFDTGKTQDLLVTPAITGTASIYVKKTAAGGTIKFYTVTANGKNLVKGQEITVELPELSTAEYVKVELPAQTSTMIGIWGSEVYVDDFEAESAEIEVARALKITNATLLSSTSPDCDPSGNFTIKMNVSVTNTGDAALNPGDEGYSLSIVANNTGAVLGTTNIDKTLEVGASGSFEVECTANVADYAARQRYDAKENIGGTTAVGGWIQPVAYVPDLVVKDPDGKTVKTGTAQNFGLVKQPKSKTFSLNNRGAAPLNVQELTIPDGFTASIEAPFTVESKKDTSLTVTLDADIPGDKGGDLIIKSESIDNFVLPLSGRVIDPAKYLVDFEDGKMPAGSIVDSNWSIKEWPEEGNSFVAENNNVTGTKIILPLVEVAEGESMTFDAAKRASTSYVSVYYSTDRKNWTLAKEVKAKDMSTDRLAGSGSNYLFTTYTIDNIPAGRYYLALESGYGRVDNIYGYTPVAVDNDIMFEKVSLPSAAMVNKQYAAKAVIRNVNKNAEADCVAELHFGDSVVATSAIGELASGEQKEVTLCHTPHAKGSYMASVLFKSGEYVLSTDTVEVTVDEEKAEKAVTAGVAKTTTMDVPVSLNYKYSETETIYTAAQLGMKEGDVINRIAYNGYNTEGEQKANVTVWMENTEDETYVAPYSPHAKEGMSQVFEGAYTFREEGTKTEPVELLSLTLSQPFTYTGKNLRIIVRSSSDTYKEIYFQTDNTDTDHAILRRNDTSLDNGSFGAKQQAVVLLYVGTEVYRVGGTVIDTHGFAVPYADVSLTNGDVLYSSKAGIDGKYHVDVIQTGKAYAVKAEAEGFGMKDEPAEVMVDKNLDGTAVTLAMHDRKFATGAPAMICLPVALGETEAKQAGEFYELKSFDGITVTVDRVKETMADKPYVFIPKAEVPFTGMASYEFAMVAERTEAGGISLQGVYGSTVIVPAADEYYYTISGDDKQTASLADAGGSFIMPFSAYFYRNGELSETPDLLFTDGTSGITSAAESCNDAGSAVWSIDGRVVSMKSGINKLKKGIYVVNGKKFVVK